MSIEDGEVEGYERPMANVYSNEDESGKFVLTEINIPNILGWFTGQKHRFRCFEDGQIKVRFDHECLKRWPDHTICYPSTSACSREMTLPVAHMNSSERFKGTFLTGFVSGQAFGRH